MPSAQLVTGNTKTSKAQPLFFMTLLFLREADLYSDKLQQRMAGAVTFIWTNWQRPWCLS